MEIVAELTNVGKPDWMMGQSKLSSPDQMSTEYSALRAVWGWQGARVEYIMYKSMEYSCRSAQHG